MLCFAAMQADRSATASPFPWFAGLIALAGITLAALWVLLGYRFSPETYAVRPSDRNDLDFSVFAIAAVVSLTGLVAVCRHRADWRRWTVNLLPVGSSALMVLAKATAGWPVQTYDVMLFCVGCGLSGLLAARDWAGREPATSRWLAVAVWSAVVLLAANQVRQQVGYFNALALGYADCGENARLIFNTITNPRELFLRVNPDKPLFYDHFNVGIVPLAPLWWLYPDIKLMILLQVVAVYGCAVPLYWIGRHTLGDRRAALLLVFAWVVYPATSQFVYSGSYGFRWGNLCLLLDFIALACWVSRRPGWALALAVWAMLIKEEAAIVVGMFGLYLALFERRRLAGAALTAFAFGFFLLVSSVIVPRANAGEYALMRFFDQLGATKWQIALSPLTRPAAFWGRLFESGSFYFAGALLAPLLFFPLRKPSVLFIGALTFVFDCLNPIFKNICFHYQAALLPVVFWALARALAGREPNRQRAALAGVVVAGVVFTLFWGAAFWSKPTLTVGRAPGRLALVREFGRAIPREAALFTTQRVGAHFVTQRYLYLDPPAPATLDTALLDLRDSWRPVQTNLFWLERLRRIQREVEAVPGLRLNRVEDGLLLYTRQGTNVDARTLVEVAQVPADCQLTTMALTGGVQVAAVRVTPAVDQPAPGLKRVRVTAYCVVAASTNLDLAVRCFVQAGGDSYVSEFQPLGRGVWPVSSWETGKFYRDDFLVALPVGVEKELTSVRFEAMPLCR